MSHPPLRAGGPPFRTGGPLESERFHSPILSPAERALRKLVDEIEQRRQPEPITAAPVFPEPTPEPQEDESFPGLSLARWADMPRMVARGDLGGFLSQIMPGPRRPADPSEGPPPSISASILATQRGEPDPSILERIREERRPTGDIQGLVEITPSAVMLLAQQIPGLEGTARKVFAERWSEGDSLVDAAHAAYQAQGLPVSTVTTERLAEDSPSIDDVIWAVQHGREPPELKRETVHEIPLSVKEFLEAVAQPDILVPGGVHTARVLAKVAPRVIVTAREAALGGLRLLDDWAPRAGRGGLEPSIQASGISVGGRGPQRTFDVPKGGMGRESLDIRRQKQPGRAGDPEPEFELLPTAEIQTAARRDLSTIERRHRAMVNLEKELSTLRISRRQALTKADKEIRVALRTEESAAPALQTMRRQAAGLGPAVRLEDLLVDRNALIAEMVRQGDAVPATPRHIQLARVIVEARVPGPTFPPARPSAQTPALTGPRAGAGPGEAEMRALEGAVRDLVDARVQQKATGFADVGSAEKRLATMAGNLGVDQTALAGLVEDVVRQRAIQPPPLAAADGPPTGPPTPFPPAAGGLPSGRRPGGPQNIVGGGPPDDPLDNVITALTPDPDPIIPRIRARLPADWYDRNYVLGPLEAATGVPTHQLAQIVPGAVTAGESVIRRFYMPVVRAIGNDVAALEQYMVLQRMKDIIARNPHAQLPGGVKGAKGILSALERIRVKIGRERFGAVERAADDLWRLNDEHSLQQLVNEGIITSQQRTAMTSSNPHYIPFQRADFVDDIDQAFTRPEANVSSTGIARMGLEGSERKLNNPLQRLLGNAIKTRSIIFRNRAARSIVEALEEQQRLTGAELVRYIEPKGKLRVSERVTGEHVARAPKGESSQVWEPISFFKDGVKHTVEVPSVYGRVAKGLGAEPDNIALRVIRAMNAPLRRGATEFNPFFLPVNVTRDTMAAMFREKLFPFGPDYFAGLWAAIRKNALFDEAAEAGALMSGVVENMRTLGRGSVRAGMGSLQVRNLGDALLFIPRFISEANVAFERGVRLAVFRKLKAEGLTDLAAAVRTRDATVDFAKSGHAMRVVNQIVPFTNAATQGAANIARTIRDHPVRSAAFGALFTSVTAMVRVNNMRFETSNLIPDYEYVRNWVVQFGEGTRADGTKFPLYLKIPKGEIAGMFTFPAEALFNLARNAEDRSAVELLLDQGISQALAMSPIDLGLVPPVPIIQTTAGLATNVNLFTGAPIIPRREQNLMAEQQFGPETSATAIALGQQIKVSPRLIDFAINDYLAGAGQSTNWLLGMALEATGFEPETFGQQEELQGAEAVSGVPGVRRFFGTRATQEIRREWELFNAEVSRSLSDFNDIPDMNRLGIPLGIVGAKLDGIKLTPGQRAEYQKIMAEYVTPRMRTAQKGVSGLPDKQAKENILATLQKLKVRAKELANRQVFRSSPPRDRLWSRENILETVSEVPGVGRFFTAPTPQLTPTPEPTPTPTPVPVPQTETFEAPAIR